MNRYFLLELKRQIKVLPLVLAVTLILFIGISTVLTAIVDKFNSDEEQQMFKVAITGDTEGDYISLGLTAMETIDDMRFTMEFLELEEKEAESLLKKGEISAYAVLPENFVDNAIAGKVDKIRFVTTSGDRGVTTMLKNELTTVITDLVIYSQKGAYGLNAALKDNETENKIRWDLVDRLSIEYVELVFHRGDMLEAESIGISDGLGFSQYYLCGMTILLLMLVGISFTSVGIKKDMSLESLLVSRGFSVKRQVLFEYLAHFAVLLTAAIFMLLCARFMPNIISLVGDSEEVAEMLLPFVLRVVFAVILLASMNVFLFELSGNLVSGILLHFFTVLTLGYITGCFYPIYSFPVSIQKISAFLPTGILRTLLAGVFTEEAILGSTLFGILAYTVIFIWGAVMARQYKLHRNRG